MKKQSPSKRVVGSKKRAPVCFTGNEGRYITIAQAEKWTGNFRGANPGAVKAHFFGSTKLKKVLDQTDCVGIRMYHAVDAGGATQLVLVGVTAKGVDLTSGLILDTSIPCPSYCDTTSSLSGTAR